MTNSNEEVRRYNSKVLWSEIFPPLKNPSSLFLTALTNARTRAPRQSSLNWFMTTYEQYPISLYFGSSPADQKPTSNLYKCQTDFDTHWPPEADMQRIIEVSSGYFACVSSIIDFVGDIQVNNPESQLKTCMKFIDGHGHVNPLQALDSLYHKIVSEIPQESL